jgi:hypothetical protein
MLTAADPLPRGARLLRRYIKRCGTSVYAFAKRYGFTCTHIQFLVNGTRRRLNVDLALDLELATGGAVPAAAWRLRKPSAALLRAVRVDRSAAGGERAAA